MPSSRAKSRNPCSSVTTPRHPSALLWHSPKRLGVTFLDPANASALTPIIITPHKLAAARRYLRNTTPPASHGDALPQHRLPQYTLISAIRAHTSASSASGCGGNLTRWTRLI